MSSEIAYCPLCAGKLEDDDDRFRCLECETEFLIQLVEESDDDEDEEEEEEEDDGDDDDEDDEEEDEDNDEY
ncbi:MAG TPA: hypothetical protein VFY29_01805 [Terriglobia bacterium]|nr:hypothetical protein [Terriglobia bacterium]